MQLCIFQAENMFERFHPVFGCECKQLLTMQRLRRQQRHGAGDYLRRDQYWSKNPMNSDTWYGLFVSLSLGGGGWSLLDADCLRRDQYWSKNPLNSDTWYGFFVSFSLGGGGDVTLFVLKIFRFRR